MNYNNKATIDNLDHVKWDKAEDIVKYTFDTILASIDAIVPNLKEGDKNIIASNLTIAHSIHYKTLLEQDDSSRADIAATLHSIKTELKDTKEALNSIWERQQEVGENIISAIAD